MNLPNREKAFISRSKIKDYLISPHHTIGRSKAKFFRMYGFDETNMDILERFLLKIAQTNEVTNLENSIHGTKYIIDGILDTPIGRNVSIRTIWIIEQNDNRPRFITAYPN